MTAQVTAAADKATAVAELGFGASVGSGAVADVVADLTAAAAGCAGAVG